jgi:hypothetical protein
MARSAQGPPVEWYADPVYQQQQDADEEGADEEEGKRAPLLQQWVSECWVAELLAATCIAPLVVCGARRDALLARHVAARSHAE